MNNYHKVRIKEGEECFKLIQKGIVIDYNKNEYVARVKLKNWFVEFGIKHNLFSHTGLIGDSVFTTTLSEKGIELFNTKNGFKKFYLKEVLRKEKIENYKYFSIKFWWIPILLSIIALIVSILN